MSEEKYVIKFSQGHSLPGGPGYNKNEQAAFNKADADTIVKLKRGKIIRTIPASKAPTEPDHHKMVKAPAKKKTEVS